MQKYRSKEIELYIRSHPSKTNKELAKELNCSVENIKYHVRKLGMLGNRKRGRKRNCKYDDYIVENYPHKATRVIAEELHISRNKVNRIAFILGVKHNAHTVEGAIKKPIVEDLTGNKYGRLTVVKRLTTNKHGHTMYICQCKCGKIKTCTSVNLKNGHTQSCGCYRREQLSKLKCTIKDKTIL